MTGLLTGKVCAITGGATGIGRAIALEFVKQGASVGVNHLGDPTSEKHMQTLQSQVPQGRIIGSVGDIGKRETGQRLVEDTVKAFGKLDIFVANAGLAAFADFLTTDESILESHIHVNIKGTFWSTQAAARQMVKQGHGGSIIGVASISALLGGKQQVHYTPTKAAILSMMQSQACALAEHGIRCNALLPGTTRTPLSEDDLTPEKLRYIEGRIPMGRIAEPEDIAGPALFLASELSRYCTGSQLLCDGGLYVNLQ